VNVPCPSPTSAATTVEAIGLDTDASWKTVSASPAWSVPASRTPKPFSYTACGLVMLTSLDRVGIPRRPRASVFGTDG
jgi:hypothetical protein